jgi:hypothetical protein
MPVNKTIFKNFAADVEDSPSGFGVLRYVQDMAVTGSTIYLLWNGTANHPQQIVKVNSSGVVENIFELPDTSFSSLAIDNNSK